MRPLRMPVAAMEHFYRGGAAIADLRGGPPRCERSPEEWLASTTARSGAEPDGLSRLEDGSLLRDAIIADPAAWLGPAHVERFGAQPELLAKLLHAGERLPVHLHPDRAFAGRHLGCAHGKTEAWAVLDAEEDTTVHLGFRVPVERGELAGLVERQDTAGLLERMHEVPLQTGDTVVVPAGVPHALGTGAFVLEVQEPTDFSILLDWRGYALDGPGEGHLGLGFDVALDAVGRTPLSSAEVEALRVPAALAAEPAGTPRPLLAPAAAPFFRADLLRPPAGAETGVPAGFGVLVVLEGSGALRTADTELGLARGDVLVLPHGAGPLRMSGAATAVLCRPPDPAHERAPEPAPAPAAESGAPH
ncbi:class I mannose-6-phosphate isomerase [Streptomonospora wellingtoniae]|uniref:Class I mannose-6-phosphate isomerase n=1 Tax=Streptomonospora wellingtoniae TaxID=3075544 RepID=A0ABU2KQ51_9ACTN|nr:class I mannose-6-phosphate isomerase [Streptomonospora sp. DSM 45055]MDT0301394.1 class I mannose-6-phosphate isomerase [Streptomonospora sp. DSM 45055]